jgi:hypothetical protein
MLAASPQRNAWELRFNFQKSLLYISFVNRLYIGEGKAEKAVVRNDQLSGSSRGGWRRFGENRSRQRTWRPEPPPLDTEAFGYPGHDRSWYRLAPATRS